MPQQSPPSAASMTGAGPGDEQTEDASVDVPDAVEAATPRPTLDPAYGQTVHELSERLRVLQRPINILSALKWPKHVEDAFLAAGGEQQPPVTRDTYPAPRYDAGELRRGFEDLHGDIRNRLGRFNPVGQLLAQRCLEWRETVAMLEARGTPDFARTAGLLYGRTGDAFHAAGPTTADLGIDLAGRLGRIESAGLLPPDERTMDARWRASGARSPLSVRGGDQLLMERGADVEEAQDPGFVGDPQGAFQ